MHERSPSAMRAARRNEVSGDPGRTNLAASCEMHDWALADCTLHEGWRNLILGP